MNLVRTSLTLAWYSVQSAFPKNGFSMHFSIFLLYLVISSQTVDILVLHCLILLFIRLKPALLMMLDSAKLLHLNFILQMK